MLFFEYCLKGQQGLAKAAQRFKRALQHDFQFMVDQAKARAREWDRGGRFDWLPQLSIPGRGHADFSLEGFAKGYSRFIAEKLCDLFYFDIVLEQAGCSVHAPTSEIRDRGLTHKTGKASGEHWAGEGHRLCQFLDLPPTFGRVMNQAKSRAAGLI